MSIADRFRAFYAQHRAASIGGAVVGVSGLALVMRKRNASKTAAAAATTPTAAAAAPGAVADTSSYDIYNQLNDQMTAWEDTVNAKIDALQNQPPGSTTPAPTPEPPPVTPPTFTPPPPSPSPTPLPVLASNAGGSIVDSFDALTASNAWTQPAPAPAPTPAAPAPQQQPAAGFTNATQSYVG